MAVVLACTAAAVAVAMVGLWGLSITLADVGIVDVWWGPGFAMIAWIAWIVGAMRPAPAAGGLSESAVLVLALVTLWALRLATHLFLRWRASTSEDRRYAAMRRKAGDAFVRRSLYAVFGLQGLLMWIISLPLQLAVVAPGNPLGTLGALGVVVFLFGFAWETVADWQLTRFRRTRTNADQVLDTGLWAWSRHPNYFGEVVLWWGLFLVTVEGTHAWGTIVSPAIVTVLLVRVSGIPMLEHGMARRRPRYAEYVARTSAFIPLPPARGAEASTPRARSA
jgi:steroid 5-alpha reductase family enzyme